MRSDLVGAARVSTRVVLAVSGGYALTAASVMVLAVALAALGMARSEAVVLAAMLGFVIYLGVLLWAFAERRLTRVIAVLLAGIALYSALLWL